MMIFAAKVQVEAQPLQVSVMAVLGNVAAATTGCNRSSIALVSQASVLTRS